ncbi:IclR family transcriptional regulator [Sphingomonas flavalba]|uniref:IclR family transcriptional regulator n=1 Tax=Sphingomonas flavalba TaxID=2559804 RepID=UPI0039E17302
MTAKGAREVAQGKVAHRKAYSAPALEKGLDILELLAREPESIGLKGIADRLGRSVGEIFRMLAVLEQRGFVRLEAGSERYRLSMRLFRLAHWHLPVNRLTSAASGPMRRLALACGQSCHLTMLSGSQAVVLAKHDSFRDRNFSMRIGAESPILTSCSGRIFFALADDFTRETLLSNIALDGDDISCAKQVAALAADIKAKGCLEVASEQVEGITDIGTPVYDHNGEVAAALIIPFLHRLHKDDSVHMKEARTALLAAGREISTALGAP